VPTTITGKQLEIPVKRLLQGAAETAAVNRSTVANLLVLDWYVGYAAHLRQRLTAGPQQGD
jgi:acetoacetyl-CoA synthetase